MLQIVSQNAGSIGISWQPPTDDNGAALLGYYAQYKTGSGSYTSSALITGLSTVLTLTADQSYLIRLVAANNEGNSVPTESVYGYASSIPTGLS